MVPPIGACLIRSGQYLGEREGGKEEDGGGGDEAREAKEGRN